MKCLVSAMVLILTICACNTDNNRVLLESFIGSKVSLCTDSMLFLNEDNYQKRSFKYTYVIYIDSIDCSECAIKSMVWWANDIEMSKAIESEKIGYAFIFSPRKIIKNQIISKIKEECIFPQYTYIDTSEVIMRNNPNIPTNRTFHTFVIDETGKIVLVGEPIRNDKIKKMFLKIISD